MSEDLQALAHRLREYMKARAALGGLVPPVMREAADALERLASATPEQRHAEQPGKRDGEHPGPPILPSGFWPERCVQSAFVAGARWWRWKHRGETTWSHELLEIEQEAIRLYGDPTQKAEQPTCSTWQPIETAPRDGTEVLVYTPNLGILLCKFCRWAPDNDWMGSDWVVTWDDSCLSTPPTHWMPLPASPVHEPKPSETKP